MMRTAVFGGAGDRLNVPNVGIVVSDSRSTVSAARTLPEARLVKADNITMLAVVVNADHNINNVSSIATDPHNDVFFLTNSSRLDLVVSLVLDRLLEIVV